MSNTYVYKSNRTLEDNVICEDQRADFVEECCELLKYYPRKNGMGQIKFANRRQYIKDKILMLQNEFLCHVYRTDVEFLVYKCPTIADIDCYCRKIIYREWPDDIDVEVT